MHIQPTFPSSRRDDPRRRAEQRIYEELAGSEAPGHALYEVRPLHSAPQLDFAVWLQGIAVYGIQVKGGTYVTENGSWYLVTERGQLPKDSILANTWDGAMAVHDVIHQRLDRKVFLIPVLALPDMEEPDQVIKDAADASRVHVLWGTGGLVERLMGLTQYYRIYSPPTARSISEEVKLVMPGLAQAPASSPAPTPPALADSGFSPPRIHIERVEVHIHVQGVDALDDLMGLSDRILDGAAADPD